MTVLTAAIILIPLYWIFISSVKPSMELFTNPIQWIPRHVTLKSYQTLIHTVGIFPQIKNTLIITGVTLILSTAICILASYAFERYPSKGLSMAYGLIVFSALIPGIVTARPLYDYLRSLKLVDTYPG